MKLFATKSISLDLTLAKERIQMQFRDKAAVSANLKQVLVDAQEQGRLTCGIYDSGTLLSKNAESVMLCVLPEDSSDDVALHIHFTLIEAFCWENDIAVIKVDSVDKMRKILSQTEDAEEDAAGWPASLTDYNCLLVEYPNDDEYTTAEKNVLEFSKVSGDVVPQLVLELAV